MTQPSTVSWLDPEAGIDAVPERLWWMLVTWDLVDPEPDWYLRLFLSEDRALAISGRRSATDFDLTGSLSSSRQDLTLSKVSALQTAVEFTDEALEAGHRWLCRPLAVDLFSYADSTAVDGFTGAGDLLNYLQHDLRGRRAVLADINRARLEARRSHADPEWMTIRPGSSLEELWEGR